MVLPLNEISRQFSSSARRTQSFRYFDVLTICRFNLIRLRSATKFRHEFRELARVFFMREMPATMKDDEARVRYQLMQALAVAERNLFILLAPDDERRLCDAVRVARDALAVPTPEHEQCGALRLRRAQGAMMLVNSLGVENFGTARRVLNQPPLDQPAQVEQQRRDHIADDGRRSEAQQHAILNLIIRDRADQHQSSDARWIIERARRRNRAAV